MSDNNGWLPIEAAPQDDTLILLVNKNGHMVVGWCGWHEDRKPVLVVWRIPY